MLVGHAVWHFDRHNNDTPICFVIDRSWRHQSEASSSRTRRASMTRRRRRSLAKRKIVCFRMLIAALLSQEVRMHLIHYSPPITP